MSIEAAIARVRAWAAAMEWRPSRLAKEAGLHDNTLRGMDSSSWNPTAETLRKLEAVIPPKWQPGDPVPDPPPLQAPLVEEKRDGEGPEEEQGIGGGEVQAAALTQGEAA